MADSPAEPDSVQRRKLGDKLARSLEVTGRSLRMVILTIATLAALLGVLAIGIGVFTWRHVDHWQLPIGPIVVTVLCAPAVLLPLLVHRRLAPITRAIEHPENLVAQARDYASDVRNGTELAELTAIATGPTKIWKPASLWRLTSVVTSFTARINPDPQRQPLLAAFMPIYLKTMWLALLVTLWALLVAVVVLGGSLIALLLGWAPTS